MSNERQASSLYTHIDVSSNPGVNSGHADFLQSDALIIHLLRELLEGQRRQNQLLEEMTQSFNAAQRQRATELGQWRDSNPLLAQRCREAAEALSGVQTEFLRNLTDEVRENSDGMLEGEFLLNEFVDRFGPRLAHLNGVLQVLSQLGAQPASTPNNAR